MTSTRGARRFSLSSTLVILSVVWFAAARGIYRVNVHGTGVTNLTSALSGVTLTGWARGGGLVRLPGQFAPLALPTM